MKKNRIVTGLDIGSSRISGVAGSVSTEGSFDILAQVSQPSKGVSRGNVVNLNETVRSVDSVLTKICNKISRGPGDIYVNISGESIKGSVSRGMIPLSARGREVSRPDIDRCIEAASMIHLPFDREIVHRIVQKFSIDDEPPVKNPIGLYASRLACEVYVITAGINHIQNIYKCVSNAGYDVKEIVFTGMADGTSLLSAEEKNQGTMLLDMGASLTEICAFTDGTLTDLEIVLTGAEDFKVNFKESPEFNSIVDHARLKLENLSKIVKSINSIVITGGVSFNDGIAEFLEEKLALRVKMGVAKEIRGDISGTDSVRLSTAIGLARYAQEKYSKKVREEKNLARRLSATVVDIFNNYF